MHPIERIRRKRELCQKTGFPQESVEVRGTVWMYYVVPPDWDEVKSSRYPRLFTWQMVPDKDALLSQPSQQGCTLFCVSDTVPDTFRRFVVLHEILKRVYYLYLPFGQRGIQASQDEWTQVLQIAPAADYVPYITMRTRFFRDMYAHASQGIYTQGMVDDLRRCYEFWELRQAHLEAFG